MQLRPEGTPESAMPATHLTLHDYVIGVDFGIGANAVSAELTRRTGFDGKIRLVTLAATTS